MHVVSISRRTDIPAFYTPWLINRLREGFCDCANPFNPQQVRRVSLKPDDVLGMVFWTRYPAPLLKHLSELHSPFYFHVTITGYGPPLELHNPPLEKAIAAFQALSDAIGPDRTLWRYDPIVVPDDNHLERFESIAAKLQGYTRRCYTSFVDLYGKTKRNLARIRDRSFSDASPAERLTLIRSLRDIAAARGITIYGCCEDAVVGEGIEKAHCVDTELLNIDEPLRRKPTREQCGCVESIDIGAYDTCRFGCAYCYATNSVEAADRRARTHDPGNSFLWRPSAQ